MQRSRRRGKEIWWWRNVCRGTVNSTGLAWPVTHIVLQHLILNIFA